jgi:hypothetical protein
MAVKSPAGSALIRRQNHLEVSVGGGFCTVSRAVISQAFARSSASDSTPRFDRTGHDAWNSRRAVQIRNMGPIVALIGQELVVSRVEGSRKLYILANIKP